MIKYRQLAVIYFCSPMYMPILAATANKGLSGDTYAFDVISSGIFGSVTHSPDAINSDSGIV